ncbi:scavenger receptor class F member 1 isoform X2 [Dromiciops gliroides]|uniref:scavenger receptor class F member 1 isoform X2 n=1 Tax=Dromiciops gliroides TaxID=33562 RepID=UPI001CC75457|nr:scavenger receptor class F member 1 isoform X2 [Dromiciops gliroides]
MGPWPLLLLWVRGVLGELGLDPMGRHVCLEGSSPAKSVCCPGWRQEGRECTVPICEGPDACGEEEICVKPGLCRCKPGFFGAQCSSRCPGQYWGPDCRESCPCHPNGQCDAATGQCTCNKDHWGGTCQFLCPCGLHGHCNPLTGACRCEPGWWTATCRKACQCSSSSTGCDQLTGACRCEPGWWGRRCSFRCSCHHSACDQNSGRCICRPGWWGPDCQNPCACQHGHCNPATGHCACRPGYRGSFCEQPCPPGSYGVQCEGSCGHCRQKQPCSPDTGTCLACEPGWNGTHCNQPCSPGTYGDNCGQLCPHCRQGEACQPESGHCQHCDPGLTGPRCEEPCAPGTFGEACGSLCPPCIEGTCDAVTGDCVCRPGYWGPSCNVSCPLGFYGVNCSSPCPCPEGPCHPDSGTCELGYQGQGALLAGILVPLLLLLVGIVVCVSCCCWAAQPDPKDRPVRDGTAVSRVKLQVRGALSSLGSALPCGSLSNHKLPRVTVSHHDAEIPFNHSFIEPPSAGWASDDSFSSDPDSGEEDEGPAYCVPPQQEEELQEAHQAVKPISAPDDASTPFAIPRTSSLARAKRPSVSFAEGTKFGPQNTQGSGELAGPSRKPKRLSRPGQPPAEGQEAEGSQGAQGTEDLQPDFQEPPSTTAAQGDLSSGHRGLPLGGRTVAQRVEAIESGNRARPSPVTTIYMLAGTPRGAEGPVRAVLRRFGSFQKGWAEPKAKGSIPKPPRRALSRDKGTLIPSPAPSPDSPRCLELSETPVLSEASQEEEMGRLGDDGTKSPGDTTEGARGDDLPVLKEAGQLAGQEVEDEPQYENVKPGSVPLNS